VKMMRMTNYLLLIAYETSGNRRDRASQRNLGASRARRCVMADSERSKVSTQRVSGVPKRRDQKLAIPRDHDTQRTDRDR